MSFGDKPRLEFDHTIKNNNDNNNDDDIIAWSYKCEFPLLP